MTRGSRRNRSCKRLGRGAPRRRRRRPRRPRRDARAAARRAAGARRCGGARACAQPACTLHVQAALSHPTAAVRADALPLLRLVLRVHPAALRPPPPQLLPSLCEVVAGSGGGRSRRRAASRRWSRSRARHGEAKGSRRGRFRAGPHDNKVAIAAAGGIAPLLDALRGRSGGRATTNSRRRSRRRAASRRWSRSPRGDGGAQHTRHTHAVELSVNADNQVAIAAAGGIAPLVALVRGHGEAKEQAAGALSETTTSTRRRAASRAAS